MTLYAFDGATPWTDDTATDPLARLKTVKAHGGVLVSVYIVGSPGGMRCANARDVSAAHSLGLGVLPNWERAADYFSTCDLAGATTAGTEALAACPALGFPDDGSIAVPFSFDSDIPTSRYPEMATKLAAADKAMGGHYRAIAYGEWGLLKYLAEHGQPGPHWLSMSTFNEEYDPGSPFVAMVQQHQPNGSGGWEWLDSPVTGTDINTVIQPNALGAWWPDNSPYGDDMPTVDEIAKAVWDYQLTLQQAAPLKPVTAPAAAFQVNASDYAHDAKYATAALISQVAGLKAAIAAVTANQNATADEITAAAQKGAQQALDAYQLTITPKTAAQ